MVLCELRTEFKLNVETAKTRKERKKERKREKKKWRCKLNCDPGRVAQGRAASYLIWVSISFSLWFDWSFSLWFDCALLRFLDFLFIFLFFWYFWEWLRDLRLKIFFWFVNRVLETWFLGRCHVKKKTPHQTWSTHGNRVFKTQFIGQNWVFKIWDASKKYSLKMRPTNYNVWKLGLISIFLRDNHLHVLSLE